MKNNNNNSNITVMDERQNQIRQKSIVCAFVFLIICMLVVTIYRIITNGDAGWEIFGIIGSCVVILISRRLLGDVEQPLDYKNRPLPTGKTKADKIIRYKNYLVESVIFGAVFAVLDILLIGFGREDITDYELAQTIFPNLSNGVTIAMTAVISFVIMFVFSFIFNCLIGEFFKVRRYNKIIAQLDEEEQKD